MKNKIIKIWWLVGVGLIALYLGASIVVGKYGNSEDNYVALIWFIAVIFPPTVSIILAAIYTENINTNPSRTLYFTTLSSVIFLICSIFITVAYLAHQEKFDVSNYYKTNSFILLPVSIIVSILMGFYYFKKPKGLSFTQGSVFISYNHGDKEIAKKVYYYLTQHKIPVFFDEQMKAGESIYDYIENCIKQSEFTLFMVSAKSLSSAWVGLESIYSIYSSMIMERKIIPLLLDSVSFEDSFALVKIGEINEIIAEKNLEREKYVKQGLGSNFLDKEIDRLIDLKNNLPKVISFIRDHRAESYSEDNFDATMAKIKETIIEE